MKKQLLIFCLLVFQMQILIAQKSIEKAIYFENNSCQLSNSNKKIIKEIAEKIDASKGYYLKIFGYASTNGSEKHNEILSKNRAYAVFKEINKHTAIKESKYYMEWLGESEDVYHLHYKNAHFRQRCVDIVISLKQ